MEGAGVEPYLSPHHTAVFSAVRAQIFNDDLSVYFPSQQFPFCRLSTHSGLSLDERGLISVSFQHLGFIIEKYCWIPLFDK